MHPEEPFGRGTHRENFPALVESLGLDWSALALIAAEEAGLESDSLKRRA